MADNNGQDETIHNNENNVDDNSEYNSVYEEEDDHRIYLNNKTYERLKQNDPTITNLYVQYGGATLFNNIDWKEDGYCIAKNTHLKRLIIDHHGKCLGRPWNEPYVLGEQGQNLPTRQQLLDFFSCIYRNSSIKALLLSSISVSDEFGGGLIEGLQGHPSLTRLDIELYYDTIDQSRLGSVGCTALGKVLKHPTSKLKELRFPYCRLDDEGLSLLCDGLLGNSTMKRLLLDGNDQITSAGWRALSTVLQHSNCKLGELVLNCSGICDMGAETLGSGSSIKSIYLGSNNSISAEGWQNMFNQLAQQTRTEKLIVNYNNINDDGIAELAIIGTLKSLDLGHNKAITPSGWQSFFNSLAIRGIQLVDLGISFNQIGIEGIFALTSLLSNMSSLKTLELVDISQDEFNNNPNIITSQGWVSFFIALHDSNLKLERLVLNHNRINNEGIQLLVPLLSRMGSLKYLELSENELVTSAGWETLSDYLQSPNFALQELHLGRNNINDDIVVALTSALVHNITLKKLDLYDCTDEDDNELITQRGWEAISTLVCNEASIMDTYNSNHTLNYVNDTEDEEENELESYLKLNKNKDKVEVARQKILQTHFLIFDDTSKIQEFLDMELEVIPTAIAWMGKPTHNDWKGTNVSGLSTMFNLMRRLPDLFDSGAYRKANTKRKRGM